jgi:hypothetical protein
VCFFTIPHLLWSSSWQEPAIGPSFFPSCSYRTTAQPKYAGFGLYYSLYYHVAIKMTSKNDTYDVYDTLKENIMRAIDEMAKIQPQISQSMSNLQIDCIQTAKNIIHNAVSAQKQFVSSWNIPVAEQYSEQFSRQSTEITNNAIKAVGINNQLAINTLDAARENLKIYNRTIDAMTDFNSNIAKAWESVFTMQQHNFNK